MTDAIERRIRELQAKRDALKAELRLVESNPLESQRRDTRVTVLTTEEQTLANNMTNHIKVYSELSVRVGCLGEEPLSKPPKSAELPKGVQLVVNISMLAPTLAPIPDQKKAQSRYRFASSAELVMNKKILDEINVKRAAGGKLTTELRAELTKLREQLENQSKAMQALQQVIDAKRREREQAQSLTLAGLTIQLTTVEADLANVCSGPTPMSIDTQPVPVPIRAQVVTGVLATTSVPAPSATEVALQQAHAVLTSQHGQTQSVQEQKRAELAKVEDDLAAELAKLESQRTALQEAKNREWAAQLAPDSTILQTRSLAKLQSDINASNQWCLIMRSDQSSSEWKLKMEDVCARYQSKNKTFWGRMNLNREEKDYGEADSVFVYSKSHGKPIMLVRKDSIVAGERTCEWDYKYYYEECDFQRYLNIANQISGTTVCSLDTKVDTSGVRLAQLS